MLPMANEIDEYLTSFYGRNQGRIEEDVKSENLNGVVEVNKKFGGVNGNPPSHYNPQQNEVAIDFPQPTLSTAPTPNTGDLNQSQKDFYDELKNLRI